MPTLKPSVQPYLPDDLSFQEQDFEMIESTESVSRLEREEAAATMKEFIGEGALVDAVLVYMQYIRLDPTTQQYEWVLQQKKSVSKPICYLASLAYNKMNNYPLPPATPELFNYPDAGAVAVEDFKEVFEYFFSKRSIWSLSSIEEEPLRRSDILWWFFEVYYMIGYSLFDYQSGGRF